MSNILYLPTRFFPSISGAEFYIQRIAEILSSNYSYNIDIYTSNAVDFRALRDPKGKIIEKNNKFFEKVNNLSIKRFPIKYGISYEEKVRILKEIKA